MRTFRPDDLIAATKQMGDNLHGFYPEEWLANRRNIALVNRNGDVGLLEYSSDGVYTAHQFFLSRGKEAVKAAKAFIKEAFNGYNIQVIRGLTPIENKGALWLTRHIGFNKYGVVDTSFGPCQLFIQTKKEWEELQNE